jgi:hypothetical protein
LRSKTERLLICLEAQAGAHRLLDAEFVDHRQHAGHRRVDQRDLAVGLAAEGGRGAGEQLGLGSDLGMDLHADDDFPIANSTPLFSEFGFPLLLSFGERICSKVFSSSAKA